MWNLMQIRNISRQLRGKEASKLQQSISRIVEEIYYKPLKHLARILLENSKIRQAVHAVGNIGISLVISRKHVITIYAIIFPRLFLGIILYVDVVTYQRISDFYRYIWLLLITRGFLAIKGLIQKYAQRNLSKLQDEYFTTTSASNGTAQLSSKFENLLAKKYIVQYNEYSNTICRSEY